MDDNYSSTKMGNFDLEDQFFYMNERHFLRLQKDNQICSWSPVDSKCTSRFRSVDLADVITINEINNDHYYLSNDHYIKKKSNTSGSSSVLDISLLRKCYSFEIHYSVRLKSKYIVEQATFCTSDFATVTKWVGKIKEKLKNTTERPKNLLVFLNPYGGRKKAVEIYEKQVEPLFKLANIDVNLLVTERVNHAYDYLIEHGWGSIDGIVCVGGDGTFSEVVNAIMVRSASDQNLNLNDENTAVPAPEVRIGIIPAGSTDTIVYSLHDTSDVTTAVIHIIAGNFLKTDVCSVHSENKYLCCFISLMSYGYLGDVIKNSLSLRWMGPIRYDCAGARHFLCHRSYEGTVSFLKESNCNQLSSVCLKNDCICVANGSTLKAESHQNWESIRGEFFMVTAANISCACGRSPNGIAPHCHFSDGYLNLLLIRRVTFCEKVKLLLTLSNSNKQRLVSNLDFVEIYKTRRFKFETGYGQGVIPATKISSWNIDGELINTPHLYVQCHPQVIRLFCRRNTCEPSYT